MSNLGEDYPEKIRTTTKLFQQLLAEMKKLNFIEKIKVLELIITMRRNRKKKRRH
jgi:hypothetical protein